MTGPRPGARVREDCPERERCGVWISSSDMAITW
jgi:hypothetical protein